MFFNVLCEKLERPGRSSEVIRRGCVSPVTHPYSSPRGQSNDHINWVDEWMENIHTCNSNRVQLHHQINHAFPFFFGKKHGYEANLINVITILPESTVAWRKFKSMCGLQVLGECSSLGEPGVAHMTAVEHLWSTVGWPHVMAEVTGGRGHIEAVRFWAGVALFPMSL